MYTMPQTVHSGKNQLQKAEEKLLSLQGENGQPQKDSDELATALDLAAIANRSLGSNDKLARAHLLHKEALEMRVRLNKGLDHADTALALHNLGHTYHTRGNYDQALKVHQEALEMRNRVFGDVNHVDIAQSIHSIAVTYHQIGKHSQSLEGHLKALNMRMSVYRDQPLHTDIAQSHATLGQTYTSLGRCGEAYYHCGKALSIRQSSHEETTETASCHSLHARVCMSVGEVEESIKHSLEALRIYTTLLGDEVSHFTAGCHYYLGDAYELKGESAESIKHHRKAISYYRQLPSLASQSIDDIILYLVKRDRSSRINPESESTSAQDYSDHEFLKMIHEKDFDIISKLRPIQSETMKSFFAHPPENVIFAASNPIRGRCLIINNTFEGDVNERKGSKIDVQRLKELFTALKFKVNIATDTKNMKRVLIKETQLDEHEQYGCFFLFIMSHGKEGIILNADGSEQPTLDLWELLGTKCFPKMAGKPKLVMIQACSGTSHDVSYVLNSSSSASVLLSKTDPAPPEISDQLKTPSFNYTTHQDLLIVQASYPGMKAYRSETKGSWFITILAATFAEQAHCKHVHDMITTVIRRNSKLRSKEENAVSDAKKPSQGSMGGVSGVMEELSASGTSHDENIFASTNQVEQSTHIVMATATITTCTLTKQLFLFPQAYATEMSSESHMIEH